MKKLMELLNKQYVQYSLSCPYDIETEQNLQRILAKK